MAIFNFGSINVDHVYQLNDFPRPGETVAAHSYKVGLGGKGANQSVAAARAGATVQHIGAVGGESDWALKILADAGVDTRFIKVSGQPTGHAIINLDVQAENTIVIVHGANHDLDMDWVENSLAKATAQDWFLLQNETNLCAQAAGYAKSRGMRVAYSAAPFGEKPLRAVLPFCDLLVLNEVEVAQGRAAITDFDAQMADAILVVTMGARGAAFTSPARTGVIPAPRVEAVDTTGAGDTFLGYLLAQLDIGTKLEAAMQTAATASALQVTRHGAIDAIPTMKEVLAF